MLLIYSSLLGTFLIPLIYCQTTYDLLYSFRFLNEESISSSDTYQYQHEYIDYTEPEHMTVERFACVKNSVRPYLYQTDPSKPSQCNANSYLSGIDLPGADFLSIVPQAADPSNCG